MTAALMYESKLRELLATYLSGQSTETSIIPLATAIGCRTNVGGDRYIRQPMQPDFAHDAFLRRVLLDALRCHATRRAAWSDNGYALLDGLVRHDRWRECLKTLDGAYAFAGLLLEFSCAADMTVAPNGAALRQAVTGDVCFALKGWLPAVTSLENDVFPKYDALARAMFGDVWCDMILPNVGLAYDNCSLKINAYRPAFLPGLLPEGIEHETETLPTLDMDMT